MANTKKYCHSCREWKKVNEFWARCSICIDCKSRGKKRGMPKGGNKRITATIPEDTYKDVIRLAQQRNVTMSKQITDMLSGMVGIPERRT